MSAYTTAVLADTPVGFWELAEPSGTTATDQMAHQNGTYTNVTGVTLGQTGIAGGATAALFTAANSGYVNIPSNASIPFGDTFTIEAWVKRVSTGTIQGIFAGPTGAPVFRFNAADQLDCVKGQTGDLGHASVTLTDTAGFHHCVWTKATTTTHIYLDGSDVTGTISNLVMATGNGIASIAADKSSASPLNFFDGTICMVAYYTTALSSTQVSAHYAAGVSGPAAPTGSALPRTRSRQKVF